MDILQMHLYFLQFIVAVDCLRVNDLALFFFFFVTKVLSMLYDYQVLKYCCQKKTLLIWRHSYFKLPYIYVAWRWVWKVPIAVFRLMIVLYRLWAVSVTHSINVQNFSAFTLLSNKVLFWQKIYITYRFLQILKCFFYKVLKESIFCCILSVFIDVIFSIHFIVVRISNNFDQSHNFKSFSYYLQNNYCARQTPIIRY